MSWMPHSAGFSPSYYDPMAGLGFGGLGYPPQITGNGPSLPSNVRSPRSPPQGPVIPDNDTEGTSSQEPHGASPSGSQPVLEMILEVLRENRLAQLAAVDQQRELIRYMRGLNEWIERAAYDRELEYKGTVARLDNLRDEFRRSLQGQTPVEYDSETTSLDEFEPLKRSRHLEASPPPRAPHIPLDELNLDNPDSRPTPAPETQAGMLTYTTTVGPSARVLYHPLRAVPASFPTSKGTVLGIQWVALEPTYTLPAGALPAPLASAAALASAEVLNAGGYVDPPRRQGLPGSPVISPLQISRLDVGGQNTLQTNSTRNAHDSPQTRNRYDSSEFLLPMMTGDSYPSPHHSFNVEIVPPSRPRSPSSSNSEFGSFSPRSYIDPAFHGGVINWISQREDS